jgi:thymidine kinase
MGASKTRFLGECVASWRHRPDFKGSLLFKHNTDDRLFGHEAADCGPVITSRSGYTAEAIEVGCANEILGYVNSDISVIGIDEAEFFDPEIVPVVCSILNQGISVVVAGLAQDSNNEPFGSMPELLAIADTVVQLYSVCSICGSFEATRTQRIEPDGSVARRNLPQKEVGGDSRFQPRCSNCWVLPT